MTLIRFSLPFKQGMHQLNPAGWKALFWFPFVRARCDFIHYLIHHVTSCINLQMFFHLTIREHHHCYSKLQNVSTCFTVSQFKNILCYSIAQPVWALHYLSYILNVLIIFQPELLWCKETSPMAGAIRHITENGCGYWRSTMSLQDIAAGVPQGSVLDPYTFSPLYSIFFSIHH